MVRTRDWSPSSFEEHLLTMILCFDGECHVRLGFVFAATALAPFSHLTFLGTFVEFLSLAGLAANSTSDLDW